MYKDWVTNEYNQWIKALQESTVHNFKEHTTVKRMLGEIDDKPYHKELPIPNIIINIDRIGRDMTKTFPGTAYPMVTGTCLRMVHHARKVLKDNPKSIVEIGGGVGQLYAILRALGYEGSYFIFDLPEVKKFQDKYLNEVSKQTDLSLIQILPKNTDSVYCISCYALGEFDDHWKNWFINNIISESAHGYVIWNPHSGASEEITFKCKSKLLFDGTKELTW